PLSLRRTDGRRFDRERHLRPEPALAAQLERAAKLVADERAHDRQAGAVALGLRAGSVVRDGEHDLAVAADEADRDMAATVLERVAEQLAEDQGDGGGALTGQLDRLE